MRDVEVAVDVEDDAGADVEFDVDDEAGLEATEHEYVFVRRSKPIKHERKHTFIDRRPKAHAKYSSFDVEGAGLAEG